MNWKKTNNDFLQEILIEAGSSSRDHILGGFPFSGITNLKMLGYYVV